MTWLALMGGLLLLAAGGELLVRGASSLASRLGMSSLVIGLTVVAFGTSAPEVAVSVGATLEGRGAIAVGNVVGSNIFNVLFILGLSAFTSGGQLDVPPSILNFDLPLMLASAIALAPIAMARGFLARWEGAFFMAAYCAYLAFLVLDSAGHDALPSFSLIMLEFVLPLVVVTLAVLLVQGLRRTDAERR